MEQRRNYPTQYEILSIEQAARRAQVAELKRLAALAIGELKALAVRGGSVLVDALAQAPASPERRGSGESTRLVRKSVIGELALSLPAELRERCASDLAAAARIEPLITGVVAVGDIAVRVLAHVFHVMARGLHAVARSLDGAAGRLTPTH